MKEREFQTQFGRALQGIGAWYYKFPDVLGDRYTAEKPCDCMAVLPDHTLWFELKVADKTFYYRDIRVSQKLNFDALTAKGQACFLVVYFAKLRGAHVIPWGSVQRSAVCGGVAVYSHKLLPYSSVIAPEKVQQTMGKRGKMVGGKASWDLSEFMLSRAYTSTRNRR